MPRFWSYLKFLFRSTNQHGVHSPFVFAYLTRCLYKREPGPRERSQKIVLKSIAYFNFRSLYLSGDQQDLPALLKEQYPNLTYGDPPYDLVVISREMLARVDFNSLLSRCHNDSMILVQDLHKGREEQSIWELLCKDPRITVSIDYYFGGLLFLRREQVKQHFRIRI